MTTQPPGWGPPQQPGAPGVPGWPPPQPVGVWPLQHPAEFGVGLQAPKSGGGRDWRIAAMAVGVALLVVAGVLVYVLGNPTPKTARARLESALVSTRSATSADITLDVKISFGGLYVGVTANGAVDFATKAESLHMSALGQTVTLLLSDGVVYEKFGKLFRTQYGKTWVRMPASKFTSGHENDLFVTDDPQGMMAELLKLGATVTPIGTATIDGTKDQSYQIVLTVAELEAHASELPPSLRSLFATAKKVPQNAKVSATMYIDPAGQLQAAHLVITGGEATGHAATASIDLTMSNFGTATVAAAPPATQTITYEQVKASTLSGNATSTTPGGVQTG